MTSSSTQLRDLSEHAGRWLTELEQRERSRTGIATLKVGYNRVHGYYIETSRAAGNRVPADYVRRQTLKNAERYITPELKAFEDEALTAQAKALALETQLFEELAATLAGRSNAAARSRSGSRRARRPGLLRRARRGAGSDRPELVDDPGIHIRQGWHPVVKKTSPSRSCPTTSSSTTAGACWSSPGRTWAASPPTCARRR
jgi:DNA mismatch repair protein MutS